MSSLFLLIIDKGTQCNGIFTWSFLRIILLIKNEMTFYSSRCCYFKIYKLL